MRAAPSNLGIDPARVAPLVALPHLDGEVARALNFTPTTHRPSPIFSLTSERTRSYRHTLGIPQTAHDFLRAMPKAELHLHSGAMNDIFTIGPRAWKLSAKTDNLLQQKYGSLERMIEAYLLVKTADLNGYIEQYDELPRYIIRDLDAIHDMSRAAALRHAENGVQLLEIRKSIKTGAFADQRYAALTNGLAFGPFEELRAHMDGFIAAENETEGAITTFLTICFRRSDSAEQAERALDEILKLRDQLADHYGRPVIIGVDIMGNEYLQKAKKFQNVFRRARHAGLKVTLHAGEGNAPEHDQERVPGEGSILDGLNSGGSRLGHGLAIYRPTPMLPENHRWTAASGINKNAFIAALIMGASFETCITSNLATGAPITLGYREIPGKRPQPIMRRIEKATEYPFEMIMALGALNYTEHDSVMCFPCADGNHTLNTDIVREYGLCAEAFDLSMAVLLAISRYSIRRSFAPAEYKANAIKSWRSFASLYLHDPRYSSPDEEAKAALGEYRNALQSKLGIERNVIEAIIREVHQPEKYLSPYMMEQFYNWRPYTG